MAGNFIYTQHLPTCKFKQSSTDDKLQFSQLSLLDRLSHSSLTPVIALPHSPDFPRAQLPLRRGNRGWTGVDKRSLSINQAEPRLFRRFTRLKCAVNVCPSMHVFRGKRIIRLQHDLVLCCIELKVARRGLPSGDESSSRDMDTATSEKLVNECLSPMRVIAKLRHACACETQKAHKREKTKKSRKC